jgi:hypothetical protein
MARKPVLYGIAAAGLVSAIALAVLVVLPGSPGDSSAPGDMSVQEVLSASTMPDRVRLYPGDIDPTTSQRVSLAERSIDIVESSGVAAFRYVVDADGSNEDITLKADGIHFASRDVYYPWQFGAPGRHPELVQQYSATSDLVTDETKYRYDGTESEHTTASDDGAKHVLGYGADGVKVIHEVVVAARGSQYGTPALQKEMRWRDDATTSLAYSNIFDSKANSRIMTDWDDQGHPLKVVVPNAYGSHNGTITTAYFPGTSLVRMHSEVGTAANEANYYRRDGTLNYVLEISLGTTVVRLFDKTGKIKVLEQTWSRDTSIVNHQAVTTFNLDSVTEVDAQGNPAREIHYLGDYTTYEEYNLTVDGVAYGEIDHSYKKGPSGFTLDTVRWWIGKADHKYDKEETHTPEEHLLPPTVPADEVKQVVNMQEDPDLLTPDPQYYGGF